MRTEVQVFTSEKFGRVRTAEVKGSRETLHPYGWWKAG